MSEQESQGPSQRRMSPGDVDRVTLLVQRALADEGREYSTINADLTWRRCIDSESEWELFSSEGSTVVSVCHGAPGWDFERKEAVPGVAHLTGLFVEARVWGRGLAIEYVADRLGLDGP